VMHVVGMVGQNHTIRIWYAPGIFGRGFIIHSVKLGVYIHTYIHLASRAGQP
jgi:NO-binding membrane sensor protein with MHYT domain